MKVNVVGEDERTIELELDDLTIASLLVKYLNEDGRTDVAAFRQEHPLEETVKLFLRVREGSPREVLRDAVAKALSDVKKLKESLLSSLS